MFNTDEWILDNAVELAELSRAECMRRISPVAQLAMRERAMLAIATHQDANGTRYIRDLQPE